jgi:membrane protein implicated in regulation of membrane protease activity
MYRFLREAFAPPSTGPERLIGTRAFVMTPLAPAGLVRLDGELWSAEAVSPHECPAAGTAVIVRAIRGLTLLVEPEEAST